MKRKKLYRSNDAPKLFILCGLPFSGKTYLSNKIAECLPVVIISFDSIHEELKKKSGKAFPLGSGIWNQVKKIALSRLSKNLKDGKNVVWDSTNPLRKYRKELIAIGNVFRAHNIVIHLNPPLTEIYARLEKNRSIRERFNKKLDDLGETLQIWEDPSEDEYAIQITSESDVIKFIADLKSKRIKG